jgi:hypothetical protein
MELFPNLAIDEMHLIAAAVKANCSLPVSRDGAGGGNGLNAAAKRIGKLILYVSTADDVLGLPIAYGDLGKNGPVAVSAELGGKLERVNRICGHCDWVGRDFESTMRAILDDGEDARVTTEAI